jgi:flagellar basal body-associated protein FliL
VTRKTATVTNKAMLRIILAVIAALVILAIVFGILTFVSDRSSNESPVTTVSTVVPSPTVSH